MEGEQTDGHLQACKVNLLKARNRKEELERIKGTGLRGGRQRGKKRGEKGEKRRSRKEGEEGEIGEGRRRVYQKIMGLNRFHPSSLQCRPDSVLPPEE